MNKFLLSLGAALVAIPGFAATFTTTMKGSGTEADPYQVTSPTHLVEMQTAASYNTTANRYNFNGIYLKMMNDIDMAGVEGFYGIGQALPTVASSNSTYTFAGVFDGNGHTIKNLKMQGETYDATTGAVQSTGANKSRQYFGLFGTLAATAKISNLTIDESCVISSYGYVGGIAGYAKAGAVIENCVNKANITCYYRYGGGVVAYIEKCAVNNCVNYGEVHNVNDYCGGVVGYEKASGEIQNCTNYGKVTGDGSYVGGITSYSEASAVVNKCVNYADVLSKKSYAAGITSYAKEVTTISSCTNYGNVTTIAQYAGGIVAYSTRSASQTATKITRCYNSGTVTCNYSYAGGIEAYAKLAEIRECVNVGDVILTQIDASRGANTQTYGGGITGYSYGCDISNCLNAGNVFVSLESCGGITGYAQDDTTYKGLIQNCLNIGSVICPGLKGMIVGNNGSMSDYILKFENCIYDAQLGAAMSASGSGNGFEDGLKGLTTAELTAGTPIAGLPASLWQYTKGYYPILASFATDEVKASAATYFTLPAGVNTANFSTGTGTLNTTVSGLTAKMAIGKYFTVSGTTITPLAAPANEIVLDTVIVTNGTYVRRFPVSQMPKYFEGEGTEAKPWLIKTKDDLIILSQLCNGPLIMHFDSKYFKLVNDIDMQNDTTFHGIGVKRGASNAYKTWLFNGVFDGDNHVISNLRIENLQFNESGTALSATSGSGNYSGFFGTLGTNAVIKNLHLDNTCYVSGYQTVGSIGAWAYTGVQILNCSAGATLETSPSGAYCGGIIAYVNGAKKEGDELESYVKGCLFYGKFNTTHDEVGGIVGRNYAVIEDCVNLSNVELKTSLKPTTSLSKFGGITGASYGTIERCANYGNVTAPINIGGITGMGGNTGGKGNIISCFNSGIVTITLDSITETVNSVKDTVHNYKQGTILGGLSGTTAVINYDGVYYDSQLAIQKAASDTIVPDGTFPTLTSVLTSGAKLEDLEGFTFQAGYYPIPTYFADNARVKEAAATFFTLPAEQNLLTGIKRGLINTTMRVKGTLSESGVFSISENRLMAINIGAAKTVDLTLTCGGFTKVYPILNPGGVSSVGGLDGDDQIVRTVYYDMQGRMIANPERGTIVTAVSLTQSGKTIVSKIVK